LSDNWIWREVPAVLLISPKPEPDEYVGGQAHVHDVEEVEELAAELHVDALGAAFAAAKRRVLDEGEVEVVVGRSAEGVAAESAETPWLGPVPPATWMGMEKNAEPLLTPWPK
jgi:hypothetical protein